jgi:hypothetical protein
MADIFVAPKKNGKKKIKSQSEGKVHEPHMHILSSFSRNPKGITFQDQREYESILLFLRPHFLTNVSWILLSIFLVFFPSIISTILPMLGMNFLSSPIITHFITVYVVFYYLLVFSYILVSFLTWFYNIFIVTPDRIVDINYSDIVVHNVSETKLNQIEDVRYSQSGFIPTLFNYGNLYAQTAAEEENFQANSIPNPKEATDIIAGLIGGHE